MSPLPLPSLSRRATIGAALAAVAALAGCDAGDDPSPAAGSGDTRAAGGDASTPTATGDIEVDDALVDATAERIAVQLAVLAAVTDGAHQLRRTLAPLVEMHEAHAAQLPEAEAVEQPRLGRNPRSLWGTVRSTEGRLVEELARAAEDARSGTLARLFASMSAGTAAHLAALPAQPPAGKGGAS